jgi:hypothetical protein
MSRHRSRGSPPPRWIDLGVAWFRQYAPSQQADDIPSPDLGEIGGYLDSTAAAFVLLDADLPSGVERRVWLAAVHDQLARTEAEFCGRILADGRDLGRWLDDPKGLTWAVPCLAQPLPELDEAELTRLGERGLRVVVLDPASSQPAALEHLTRLGHEGAPPVALDLSRLGDLEIRSLLDWLEPTAVATDRFAFFLRDVSADEIGRLSDETLHRLARAGGLVGVALKGSPNPAIRATIERLQTMGSSQRLAAG